MAITPSVAMSWVWLDGVRAVEKGKSVKAWKTWEPTFPAAYLIEMIAQAGAILLGAESDYQDDLVFTKIESFEFLKAPEPGTLEIEAEPEALRREGGWFLGRIFQKGEKIVQGRVLLMNVGRLHPGARGPVTFPRELLEAVR